MLLWGSVADPLTIPTARGSTPFMVKSQWSMVMTTAAPGHPGQPWSTLLNSGQPCSILVKRSHKCFSYLAILNLDLHLIHRNHPITCTTRTIHCLILTEGGTCLIWAPSRFYTNPSLHPITCHYKNSFHLVQFSLFGIGWVGI